MERAGILLPDDEIVVADVKDLYYAYVYFDRHRARALPAILSELERGASTRSAATGVGAYLDGRCDQSGKAAGRTAQRAGCPAPVRLSVSWTRSVISSRSSNGGAQEVALYAVSHLDRTRFRPVLLAGPGGLLTEEARRLPGVQTIIVPSWPSHSRHQRSAGVCTVVLAAAPP